MKDLYTKLLVIVFFVPIISVGQNISVNTTGAANSTSSMFEVIQPVGAASSSIGIFARHLGTAANAYAIWAEATGATNKYAIVVPAGGGSVGIGTTTPGWPLDIVNNQNFYTLIGIRNNDPGTSAASGLIMYNDVAGNYSGFGLTSSGFNTAPYTILGTNRAFWSANSAMSGIIINNEGANPIMFSTSFTERMRVDGNGNVGIGATSPGELLEVYAADPTIRIRNQNDQGGGFIGNTWLALQFGMYNPGGSAWGAMAVGEKKSFFGMDYTGKVGSLTNSWWTPVFRNVLDNGSGWAGIGISTPQGLLDVNGGATGLDALFVKTDGGANPWQGGIVHHQNSTYAFKQTVQNTSSATLATMQFDYVSRTSPTTVTTSNILVLQSNGSVGIGNIAPNSSALLDMASTTKGLLPPRMTEAQRDAIGTPATGLLVYQSDSDPGFYWYSGAAWTKLSSDLYSNTTTVYSTGAVTTTAAFAVIPGVTQTITLDRSAKVLVMVDGGVQVNSAVATDLTIADVAIHRGAALLTNGGFKRSFIRNATAATYMLPVSLNSCETLAAGTYTYDVRARDVSAIDAVVGGASGTVLQFTMIVQIIYQ